MFYQLGVVSPCQHCGDLRGQKANMEIMGVGNETPLSAIRLCGMGISPSGAFDVKKSPHLIIGHLLMMNVG